MLSNTQIYIIDFDDSFTYNIANILYPHCKNIEVINHDVFFNKEFKKIVLLKNIGIILGPGPGHPSQYQKYSVKINQLLNLPSIYLMGICLGHQLIAKELGYIITTSVNPMHGEKVSINIANENFLVQRYNSLAVTNSSNTNEIMLLGYENGRSYQFHPESVGTEKAKFFFYDLLTFLKIS